MRLMQSTVKNSASLEHFLVTIDNNKKKFSVYMFFSYHVLE